MNHEPRRSTDGMITTTSTKPQQEINETVIRSESKGQDLNEPIISNKDEVIKNLETRLYNN